MRSCSQRPKASTGRWRSATVRLFWGLVALGLAMDVTAAPPVKRAAPPTFDKSATDVFFPDARAKLVGKRPERRSSVPADARPAIDSPARPAQASAAAGWKELIDAETIEDEIKSQQIALRDAIKNATKFKGGDYQKARLHFTELATLFAIDAQYDEPMRWKRESPAMRDRMAKAGFNCKVGTDASFKDATIRSEELENLVRGGSPQLPTTATEFSWPKVADRPPLMKRLEQSQQLGLAPWTANAAEFARNLDKLSHESQLVAALARVIQQAGYEFAEDESYLELARGLETEATKVREAAAEKNYEQARKAVGEISKACSKCHEGYRS